MGIKMIDKDAMRRQQIIIGSLDPEQSIKASRRLFDEDVSIASMIFGFLIQVDVLSDEFLSLLQQDVEDKAPLVNAAISSVKSRDANPLDLNDINVFMSKLKKACADNHKKTHIQDIDNPAAFTFLEDAADKELPEYLIEKIQDAGSIASKVLCKCVIARKSKDIFDMIYKGAVESASTFDVKDCEYVVGEDNFRIHPFSLLSMYMKNYVESTDKILKEAGLI